MLARNPNENLLPINLFFLNPCLQRKAELPLGCLYLAAALRDAGYPVILRDYQTETKTLDTQDVVEFLECHAGCVAISCMHNMLPSAVAALKRLKEADPGRVCILGGPGPSGVAESLLERFPWLDIIVIGEGEVTAVELMDALLKTAPLSGVAGIAYRDHQGVHVTPRRQLMPDLDTLPFPAYGLLPNSAYLPPMVLTSRGCPMNCPFCNAARYWQCYRAHSVDRVLSQIRYHSSLGWRGSVRVADDTFTLDPRRVKQFSAAYRAESQGDSLFCNIRIDQALRSRGMIDDLLDAGLRGAFIGVESGSEAVLRRLRKPYTASDVMSVVSHLASHLAELKLSFMWGFPFETRTDLISTLLLMDRIRERFGGQLRLSISLHLLCPLPQTDFYESYADCLQFSAELISSIVSPLLEAEADDGEALRRAGLKFDAEALDLIQSHKDVFPGFYHIPSASLSARSQLVKRAGLGFHLAAAGQASV